MWTPSEPTQPRTIWLRLFVRTLWCCNSYWPVSALICNLVDVAPLVVHADSRQGVAGAADKRVTTSGIVHSELHNQRETTSDRRIVSTAGRKSNWPQPSSYIQHVPPAVYFCQWCRSKENCVLACWQRVSCYYCSWTSVVSSTTKSTEGEQTSDGSKWRTSNYCWADRSSHSDCWKRVLPSSADC